MRPFQPANLASSPIPALRLELGVQGIPIEGDETLEQGGPNRNLTAALDIAEWRMLIGTHRQLLSADLPQPRGEVGVVVHRHSDR